MYQFKQHFRMSGGMGDMGGGFGGGSISMGAGDGGLGIIGDVFGGVMGYIGAHETNEMNAEIARQNRLWQEQMSGSAYQRAVNDMRAAGLNPMLAYSQGGASTPTPQTYNFESPTSRMGEAVKRLASSALERQKLAQEVRGVESNIQLQDAQKVKAAAETAGAIASAQQAQAQAKKTTTEEAIMRQMAGPKLKNVTANTAYKELQTSQKGLYTDAFRSEAELQKKTADLHKSTGYFTLDNMGNLFNKFKGLFGGSSAVAPVNNWLTPKRR